MKNRQELEVAILVLAFNRPDFLASLLKIVEAAQPTKVYVAVDGPRTGNMGDLEAHAEIARILREKKSTLPLKTLIRRQNLGCKVAVSSAIDWFFQNEDRGIILEDDCHPDLSFFDFCREMLARYENDSQIVSISGYRAMKKPHPRGSVTFSVYPQVWGWATWKHAWSGYDSSLVDWPNRRDSNWLCKEKGMNPLARAYWTRKFDLTHRGEVDTWDYQFTYLSLSRNGLSVIPPVNLVRNVGFDERSTHVKKRNRKQTNQEVAGIKSITVPPEVQQDRKFDLWLELRSYRMIRSVLFNAIKSWLEKMGLHPQALQ